MSLLLHGLDLYTPPYLQRRALHDLFGHTAAAFGVPVPRLDGLASNDLLAEYAVFTRDRANAAIARGDDLPAVQQRLHRRARGTGTDLRRLLRVRTRADFLMATRILYRMIGIDVARQGTSDVCFHRCFFSQYYSPSVCGLIAALDDGLVAGLSGRYALVFRQRITEGAPCCLATLVAGDSGR